MHSHPNLKFVESVLVGLCEGFQPYDGEWKIEVDEVIGNYPLSNDGIIPLQKHWDKEQVMERWPGEVDRMLAEMKISPMFVVWKKGKVRVITDHKGSGLHDGIALEDVKVWYNDMHNFGQALDNAREANLSHNFVTFKSDNQSTFLNLLVLSLKENYTMHNSWCLGTRALL